MQRAIHALVIFILLVSAGALPPAVMLPDARAGDAQPPLPRYEMKYELIGHTSLVRCVAFQPGTHLLATGGSDRSLRLWNSDKGTPIAEHILPRGG